MSQITLHQVSRLPRACESAQGQTQIEAIIPVPVPNHPLSRHFRVCGLGHFNQDHRLESHMKNLTAAAARVGVEVKGEEMQVVVDGKYVAGGFRLADDYSSTELAAAEGAARAVLQLAEGRQPDKLTLG